MFCSDIDFLLYSEPTKRSSFWHSVQINFKKFVNKSVTYGARCWCHFKDVFLYRVIWVYIAPYVIIAYYDLYCAV